MHLGEGKKKKQNKNHQQTQTTLFFLGFQTPSKQVLNCYVVVLETQTSLSLNAQRVSLSGTWFAK